MMKFVSSLVVAGVLNVIATSALQSTIYDCDYFTTDVCEDEGGTNNAMMNYGSCYFSACGGHNVVISNYQNCVGDTFLRLYDSSGSELSYHDDVYWVRKWDNVN